MRWLLPLTMLVSLYGKEYGPPVGTKFPEFSLQDQNGKAQTLQSVLGPKGAVVVFHRSADW